MQEDTKPYYKPNAKILHLTSFALFPSTAGKHKAGSPLIKTCLYYFVGVLSTQFSPSGINKK
jgi:hypothetical protein